MSTNCLKTQLKSVVENDELNILGVLKLHITAVDNPTGDTQYVQFKGTAAAKIKFVGGTFSTSYGGASVGDEITLAPDGTGGYAWAGYHSNNNGEIQLPKYTITTIWGQAINHLIYLRDVDYSQITAIRALFEGDFSEIPSSATYIEYVNTDRISGNVNNMLALENLKDLRLNGSLPNVPAVFDLVSFGKQIALTNIALRESTTGSIEDFVRAQCAHGRTSCNSLTMPWIGSTHVTFNNASITPAATNTLSWALNSSDNTKIDVTFNGTTITISRT